MLWKATRPSLPWMFEFALHRRSKYTDAADVAGLERIFLLFSEFLEMKYKGKDLQGICFVTQVALFALQVHLFPRSTV